jgi:hypothetical protein
MLPYRKAPIHRDVRLRESWVTGTGRKRPSIRINVKLLYLNKG